MTKLYRLSTLSLLLVTILILTTLIASSQSNESGTTNCLAASGNFELCDIGQTYTQVSPYSASEITITNDHSSQTLTAKVDFYWSYHPDIISTPQNDALAYSITTAPIPAQGQKIIDLINPLDPTDPNSLLRGTFNVVVTSINTGGKLQPTNTTFTVIAKTRDADGSLPNYEDSYSAIRSSEVGTSASISEVYNNASRNGQVWWSEIVVQNLSSAPNTVTISLDPAAGGNTLSNNEATLLPYHSRVFLVSHLAFDVNKYEHDGTFAATVNGTGDLAVTASHFSLDGNGQTDALEQVRQTSNGGAAATHYLPAITAPNVAFDWDNTQPPGLPGSDYGLSFSISTEARDKDDGPGNDPYYPDTPDWVVDKNWYFWSTNYSFWVKACNDPLYIPMIWAFDTIQWPNNIKLPSNCSGRPLLLANEPDLGGQANMSIDQLARMTYVYRDWPGELYSPAFNCYSRTNSAAYNYRCPSSNKYFDKLVTAYEAQNRWEQGDAWSLPYDGLAIHVYLPEPEWDVYYPELPALMAEWQTFATSRGMDIMVTEYGIDPNTMTEAGSKELRIARRVSDLTDALQAGLVNPKKLIWFLHARNSQDDNEFARLALFVYDYIGPPGNILSCSYIISGECQPASPVGTTWVSWVGTENEAMLPEIDAFTADSKLWTFDATYSNAPWRENNTNMVDIYPYGNTPCTANPNPSIPCTFDTRNIIVQPNGMTTDSITAYGKYWNFDITNGYQPVAGNGNDLEEIERYNYYVDDNQNPVYGPCYSNPNPAMPCIFDTREIFVNSSNVRIESITAYGKYWNFNIDTGYTPFNSNGDELTDVTRYFDDSIINPDLRPCNANPNQNTPCTFDTRNIIDQPNGDKIESITAYGRYWNFDINNNYNPFPDNGSVLTSISRYFDNSTNPQLRPCNANPNQGTLCTFDSREVQLNPDDTKTESITAYGRYWVFNVLPNGGFSVIASGSLLDVLRYGNVPCRDQQTAGACNLDTRSISVGGNGHLIESITAYGRYWNYDIEDGYLQLAGNGSDLLTVPRYAYVDINNSNNNGPCAELAPYSCTFDTRLVYFDPWVGTRIEFITAYGKYWKYDANDGHSVLERGELTSLPWYNDGPCDANPSPATTPCTFDTYIVVGQPPGQKFEFITAYNKYWIYAYASPTSTPTLEETGWLDNDALNIPATIPGPCPAYSAEEGDPTTWCTLDTRAFFNIGW